jgi:hypothetical protein
MRPRPRSLTSATARLALRRGAACLLVAVLAAGLLGRVPPHASAADAVEDQAARGAAIYAFSCAACHGRTGAGFEEAVAAFPADHRACGRCHHPSNAAQMPGSQAGLGTMAFSLGDPPRLADGDRLARFGSADALFHFVRATMPRWAPASLDDAAYLDVTAHLLRMVGMLGEGETLTFEALPAKRLE